MRVGQSTYTEQGKTGPDLLTEQQRADAEDALQAAMDAHNALQAARRHFNAACARLAPFRNVAQQVAA